VGTLKVFPLVLVFTCILPCRGQESDAIQWNAHRKISWQDFRGKPFKTAWAAATTASGIGYSYTGEERADGYELHFKVGAYFYPNKSWYQPKLCNERVLEHEQLHFDISELCARKLRRELETTRFSKNAKAEIEAIYNRVLLELSKLQSRYDHETNYSRDSKRQAFWSQKIRRALEEHK